MHLFLIFTFCLPIIWPLRSLRCWNKSSPWSPSLCACLLPDCFSPNGAPTFIPIYCGITIGLPVLYSLDLIIQCVCVAQCSVFLLFCVFLVLSIVVCVFQRGPYCVSCVRCWAAGSSVSSIADAARLSLSSSASNHFLLFQQPIP